MPTLQQLQKSSLQINLFTFISKRMMWYMKNIHKIRYFYNYNQRITTKPIKTLIEWSDTTAQKADDLRICSIINEEDDRK